jgi:hypothetical protein
MKGKLLKIYPAVLLCSNATIMPMVRWSFLQTGFHFYPKDLSASLTVIPAAVLDQMVFLKSSWRTVSSQILLIPLYQQEDQCADEPV